MEGESPSRRSRSFSALLSGYTSISEGSRGRLGGVVCGRGRLWENEVKASLADAPEAPKGPNQAFSNQLLVPQAELIILKIMEQITQFMGQCTQVVSPSKNSKAPAFKTSSMREPNSFDGTQDHKLRVFIKSSQLIFHKYPVISSLIQRKFFT
ncbi:hypothetical protein O181_004248 [Austropuccinia psidii MF-1]|uniref:Uncharacterized protein n=1 Tax=Austropuccinia psidii MF-1 TaxID=1389203 RepID=A0A9Q3BG79_9BASI|nr:hypothetical protein [Austropuccinia psidii MF-1]